METLQEKKQNKIYAIYSETLGQCYLYFNDEVSMVHGGDRKRLLVLFFVAS